jgi:hypothetical protein
MWCLKIGARKLEISTYRYVYSQETYKVDLRKVSWEEEKRTRIIHGHV